jgi:hypothetical protein
METPFTEEWLRAHSGLESFNIERVLHLRDQVFPEAGVVLSIQDGRAYAVTPQGEEIQVALLKTLMGMADAQVVSLVQQVIDAYRKRRPLKVLRVQAGFLSQKALALHINSMFEGPTGGGKPVISARTIWRAENKYPISETSARLIIPSLRVKGVEVEIGDVDWVIGHQGKRREATAE